MPGTNSGRKLVHILGVSGRRNIEGIFIKSYLLYISLFFHGLRFSVEIKIYMYSTSNKFILLKNYEIWRWMNALVNFFWVMFTILLK